MRERTSGFYAFRFGDLRLVALSDGVRHRPYDTLLTRTTVEHARAKMAEAFLTSPAPISTNAFLFEGGGRVVLVDTGAGTFLDPLLGKVPDSLRAAGYTPEDVTDVVLTHLHTDHVGGLLRGDWIAYPKATVHVPKRDADYWLDPAERSRAAAGLERTFATVSRTLEPYRASGQLRLVADEMPFLPGTRLLPRPGHSPGAVEVRLETDGRTMLFAGDLIHSEHVQFAEPDIAISFDFDQDDAIASRRAAFEDAADNGYWLALAHVAFPGIGRVRRAGEGFTWVPITYGLDP